MENIVRKGEIAFNKQFLLFSQCFVTYMAIHFHFKCTLQCCLLFVSIWTSLRICRLVKGYLYTYEMVGPISSHSLLVTISLQ